MFDDLLPLRDEAPRCNDFARSLGLRPPGTGLCLDRVILVSVPLPWPKPALKHPRLEAAARHVNASSVASRLFAVEPFDDAIDVEVYERDPTAVAVAKHRWKLDDPAATEPLVAAIAEAPIGSLSAVISPGATRAEPGPPNPTFLVCTQGSHDQCCGTSGVALADHLANERPHYTVRRVSHTGGHRFSPTLMSFPEGRMWAYVDLDLVDRIAGRATTADDYRLHARGWWGAKVGPAQVAECAVRSELTATPFEIPHISEVGASEGLFRFEVSVSNQAFVVEVSIGRQVPSISCEAPGGLPVKPGREFAWTIERAGGRV